MQMRNLFFAAFVLACALALAAFAFADGERADDSRAPYQIPQTIYIGDHGRLVYPLNGFFLNQEDGPSDFTPPTLPDSESPGDIIINGVEVIGENLIIDFQVFKTGIAQLPPIVISGETLSGLEVYVSSILEESGDLTILSPSAQPLNAPGTIWIIITIVLVVIFAVAFLFLFVFKGGAFFSGLKHQLRHRRIIHQTQKAIKKLKINLDRENIGAQTALAGIANELRLFLDNYFNIHCRAMAPPEFLKLSIPDSLASEYSANYFYEFFMKCDTIRFSGAAVSEDEVREIIAEVETLVASVVPDTRPLPTTH
jgi:hypothetical protein